MRVPNVGRSHGRPGKSVRACGTVPEAAAAYGVGMVSDDATWYELWPDSHRPTEPERYRDKAEAREAAARMRSRETSLQYVDIVAIQIVDGEALKPRPVDSL